MKKRGYHRLFRSTSVGWLSVCDIRIKGTTLLLVQATLWIGRFPMLVLLIGAIVVLYATSQVSLLDTLYALRGIATLCALIIIIGIVMNLSAYIELFATPYSVVGQVVADAPSLFAAPVYVGRFFFCLLAANLFLATTNSGQIIDLLEWIFHPLGYRKHSWALTCMLVISLVDRYLIMLSHIQSALWGRRFSAYRSPRRAIQAYSTVLVRIITEHTTTLAHAIYLRRYGHQRSSPHFQANYRDWVLLAGGVLVGMGGIASRMVWQ